MFDIRVKIFSFPLQLLTLIIFSGVATAQTSKEVKDLFAQAEAYYLYGEFELANPIYLTIASFQPDNDNINYKIGNCYLNITDEKNKAIEFLEKAVKNSSPDAKPDQMKEKRAPLDAYFSLARAYMINNELDKAISTFLVFQRLLNESKDNAGIKNVEFVDQQILACKNAIKSMEAPVNLDKVKLPDDFSLGSDNENPAVSFDGNTIAYTERRGLSSAIFYSKRERGKWQSPVEITFEINAGEDCSTCSLNSDGTELFLYKEDMEDGNIYSSVYSDGKWSPVKKLNGNINTKFFESHASISADGKRLYFTSNRDDGQDLDVFVSEKEGPGDWGPAKNIGNEINTPFNEDTPFIIKDDTVLYFSSEGHESNGGYDLYKAIKKGDSWKKPENLGYPINTTDDNRFFQPFNNGLNGYYSMATDYKKREIFYLGIGIPAIDIFFDIKGTLSLNDTTQKQDESNRIFLLDLKTEDTLKVAFPQKDSGFYKFTVTPGAYRLMYTGINYITSSVDTSLAPNYPSPEVRIDVILEKVPEPVTYEKIDLNQIPVVADIDSSILVKNMNVSDISANIGDSEILYFTVQVMALHNPVDVSYFKYITDMKVMYNDIDKFYRYTTGRFATREEAAARKAELTRKGYPNDIFIKKVSK